MTSPTSDQHAVLAILASLESNLIAVEQLGAHIAAAHLDASIHQLRLHAQKLAEGQPDKEGPDQHN